ncbi:tetratricopeptide repeat protein [candidate division CSSED10-310 bacterium]|uniref:Tetratricopeptide repeat protein n=1 Tax=candidate division CSSED10-310 bacterium TaxID=2855610 RepID=A0ABV6YR31_UNCC1
MKYHFRSEHIVKFSQLLCLFVICSSFFFACAHGKYPSDEEELKFAIFSAQKGLWQEARFRFENLIEKNPNNAFLHNNLAIALEALRQFKDAEKEYIRARDLDPNNTVILENYNLLKRVLKEKVVQN